MSVVGLKPWVLKRTGYLPMVAAPGYCIAGSEVVLIALRTMAVQWIALHLPNQGRKEAEQDSRLTRQARPAKLLN